METTLELLMLRAFERGLSLREFEEMTPGMIIDYIITYNNDRLNDDETEDSIREAGQEDFDRF